MRKCGWQRAEYQPLEQQRGHSTLQLNREYQWSDCDSFDYDSDF